MEALQRANINNKFAEKEGLGIGSDLMEMAMEMETGR
jgi:hypothetical protein